MHTLERPRDITSLALAWESYHKEKEHDMCERVAGTGRQI